MQVSWTARVCFNFISSQMPVHWAPKLQALTHYLAQSKAEMARCVSLPSIALPLFASALFPHCLLLTWEVFHKLYIPFLGRGEQ